MTHQGQQGHQDRSSAGLQNNLAKAVVKLGIGDHRRHVFLCTGPNCCTPETGQAAWEALKKGIKEAGLTAGPNACNRTKVGCLRICCHGPTLLVYPEGTWYHGMEADRIPQFVRQHLVEGKAVTEFVFAVHPLASEEKKEKPGK